MKLLEPVRLPTINAPRDVRRKLWANAFLKSYLVVFFAYFTMYLARKNFNVAQNDLIETYHFTKTDLGLIAFAFSIPYGIGKTVIGYYIDGKNTKNAVCLLLILSGLAMFGMGLVSGSIAGMALFYGINGFVQSAGGPGSYATIVKWSDAKRKGTFLGAWNWSHNLGGAAAASVATWGAQTFFDGHVVGMFIVPAVIAVIIGVIGLFMGGDSPEAYGLGKTEEIFDEPLAPEDKHAEQEQLSKWQIFVKYVLGNPVVWVLCLTNLFCYVVRIGVDQWGVVYSKEVLGLSKEIAKQGFTYFELGAFFGSIGWGLFSDVIRGRRGLAMIIAFVLTLFLVYEYQHARSATEYLFCMSALGFLIYGPQLLVGVSIVSFVPKRSAAVVDGLRGTFGYILGDSFAKIGMGMMADKKISFFGYNGWDGTFAAMYVAAVLGIITVIYVAGVEEKKIRLLAAEKKASAS